VLCCLNAPCPRTFAPAHPGEYTQADGYGQYEADGDDYQTYGTEYNQQDGGDYYGSSFGADGGGEYEQYGLSDAIPEFSSDSYYKGGLAAADGPLDLQEDSTAIPEPAVSLLHVPSSLFLIFDLFEVCRAVGKAS